VSDGKKQQSTVENYGNQAHLVSMLHPHGQIDRNATDAHQEEQKVGHGRKHLGDHVGQKEAFLAVHGSQTEETDGAGCQVEQTHPDAHPKVTRGHLHLPFALKW